MTRRRAASGKKAKANPQGKTGWCGFIRLPDRKGVPVGHHCMVWLTGALAKPDARVMNRW
jgi:hypothetical protein